MREGSTSTHVTLTVEQGVSSWPARVLLLKILTNVNCLPRINYFNKAIVITSSRIPFLSVSTVILNCQLTIKAVGKQFCEVHLHILFFEMLITKFTK